MRTVILLFCCVTIAGCAWIDADNDSPAASLPSVLPPASCTDIWKRYTDEVRLVMDDEANWQAHDENAQQYLAQFSLSCNAADSREAAAAELRCKA